MTKYIPNLDVNDEQKQTAYVVERTNEIESKLRQVFEAFFAIEDQKRATFLHDIMLNNALFPLSSKVKAYFHLNKENNWPTISVQRFQEIMFIRNGFAHDLGNEEFHIQLDKDNNAISAERFVFLESVSMSGTLVRETRQKALEKYTQSYVEVNEHLIKILGMLKNA